MGGRRRGGERGGRRARGSRRGKQSCNLYTDVELVTIYLATFWKSGRDHEHNKHTVTAHLATRLKRKVQEMDSN